MNDPTDDRADDLADDLADDPIVEEVRGWRRAHSESFDYDLVRITKDLQEQERNSGVPVVRRAPRPPQDQPNQSST